jgi:hypothetical protein
MPRRAQMNVLNRNDYIRHCSIPRLLAISSNQLSNAIVYLSLQFLLFGHKISILKQLETFLPVSIMSTTIAIAGGTGNIGKTISDALVAAAKYKVIVLARKVRKFFYQS